MHIVWTRNDIRLDDNPALYHACKNSKDVTVIYIATPKQWQRHDEAPAKLGFRSEALSSFRLNLANKGIAFSYYETEYYQNIPQLLADICHKLKAKHVWFNEEIPFDEKERDNAVVEALEKNQISCHPQSSNRIVNYTLLNQQGKYYKVFTPWYKAWLRYLDDHIPSLLPPPRSKGKDTNASTKPIVLPGSDDFRADIWPADEKKALQQTKTFINERVDDYIERRDYPAINGTSTISPYLASGIVSPRRCFDLIQQHSVSEGLDWRTSDWLRELAWREFYYYLMGVFPRLCKNRAFKPETEALEWEKSELALQAWKDGLTGFPLVDAAMRQLNRTGWMHNRLRMLTASFLSKLLLIDWREGEKYFMQKLLDGDFASNNGGWQWSASTGCDASPWFRIFNPYNQSEKFDPQGEFIRKMVPELADIKGKEIHNPSPITRQATGYPEPIVDYKFARARVLERFKNLPKK